MDVLVVDDDRDSRTTLVKVLERSGFMVGAAQNGLEALAMLQQRSASVIVCDIRMAFLDGRHVFQELKRLDPELAGRMLFVTGHAGDPDIAVFLERSGQPVVQKPYEIDDLVESVRAVMRHPQRPSHPGLSLSLARARRLPDLFRSLPGDPSGRVAALVQRFWGTAPDDAQRELGQSLLAILASKGTVPDAPVDDTTREECAESVEAWFLAHEHDGGD
ncbi:MAG: response regulator [Gemmatimonadales bacterium]|jgi:DNA-binding response OmpR family regulator